jgi:hypothetical protein
VRSQNDAQLDQRDLSLLAMLAEQRVTIEPQAGHWLNETEQESSTRLERLHAARMLKLERIFHQAPAAVTITRRGLAAVGSTMRTPQVDLRQYRHDVGVAWLWQAAHAGYFGAPAAIVSERSMRSHDWRLDHQAATEPAERFGVGIGGVAPGGAPRRHYPDLLVDTRDGRRVAVELELTAKSRPRIDEVMLAYASDGRVAEAAYLVPDARLARFISDAARRAEISEIVTVKRLNPKAIDDTTSALPRLAGSRAAATRPLTHTSTAKAADR